MISPNSRTAPFRPSLWLTIFAIFLASLWVAGGASRPDVLGQVVVRIVATLALFAALLTGARSTTGQVRPVLVLLLLALALTLLQLVPLPPALWQAIPGRALLVEAAAVTGQPQPWRPLSMVPGTTINAAASLIVPLAALMLATKLDSRDHARLPGLLLVFVGASMIVGILQFAAVNFDNPLINDDVGIASGMFANRNHFALLLGLGCLLAPVWAVDVRDGVRTRLIGAGGLIVLFLLALLASGSRAGLLLGPIGLALGFLIAGRAIRKSLSYYPKWAFPSAVTAVVMIAAGCVVLALLAGRAESIERAFAMSQGQDMRIRALPVLLDMIRYYFPLGTGLGSFDPVFRIHEPEGLLKPTYFNHAHNDFVEIALTAGVPGVLLLIAAVAWWAWASFAAWRMPSGRAGDYAKLGSGMLFLILLASIFDYPARTPAIMAFGTVAAFWLAARRSFLGFTVPTA